MTGFALMLVAAALAFGLGRLLRIPPIPLLMLAGAGLNWALHALHKEVPVDLITEMTEVGLAVLVFTAGIDLSPHRLRGRAKPVLLVGLVQFFALGLAGVSTAVLLGYDLLTAFYLGCALSASSTLVVVRHLQQRQQLFEPYGRLVLGVLLLQDVIIILLLVVLHNSPLGGVASALGVAKAIGLGVLALGAHRWLVPWVAARFKLDEEELMLGSLAMLFAFSGMAHLLDLPFLVGRFWPACTLRVSDERLVRGMLGSISGFFLALFFISTMVLTLPDWAMLQHCLIFAVAVLVTAILVTIVMKWPAIPPAPRSKVASCSQTSEFSLLLAVPG